MLGYLDASALAMLELPIGDFTKDEVRDHARRLGLRTWNKPDSQDVCFIEASRGREAFLRERIEVTPARIVDLASGEDLGAVEVAELVTVGQRRVEVGRLADVLVDEVRMDEASLTFAYESLRDGERVLAQWSAHGAVHDVTYREAPARLELDGPVRPVAAGQSAVFYRPDAPSLVVGAGIVAP